jgi:hypothetical protein
MNLISSYKAVRCALNDVMLINIRVVIQPPEQLQLLGWTQFMC